MQVIRIRPFSREDAPQLLALQHKALAACPDMAPVKDPGYYTIPPFQDKIFCAVDAAGSIVGYAMAAGPTGPYMWMDIKVDPDRADAIAIKDRLLDTLCQRAKEIKREHPEHEALILNSVYNTTARPSIEYLGARGFTPYVKLCSASMQRDLSLPIPEDSAPAADLEFRRWRLDTPEARHMWLTAHNEIYPDMPCTPERLEHGHLAEWGGYRLFGAFTHGGELAGTMVCYSNDEEIKDEGVKAGYTEHVFVMPPYRRLGIARHLILQGMRYLKEQGFIQARLGVSLENAAARALYESLGYAVVREEVSMAMEIR